jgi:hypothetical protein
MLLDKEWLMVNDEFGVQTFRFGRFLESNPLDLGVFWSPTLQLWAFFGVQTFRFGRFLESNALALEA